MVQTLVSYQLWCLCLPVEQLLVFPGTIPSFPPLAPEDALLVPQQEGKASSVQSGKGVLDTRLGRGRLP